MTFVAVSGGLTFPVCAQETGVAGNDTVPPVPVDSMQTGVFLRQPDTLRWPEMKDVSLFRPNSRRAVIYSAIFPGLGQIYNRKYWKLPLVYGGYMGFIYAVTWNNKNYQDYSRAYFDLAGEDPNNPDSWHDSWLSFVPAGREPASYLTDANFKSRLKNGRDFYRRYRDLSIILTVGWYFICMADAYVDAQLFDFDITPDLSLRIEPVVSPATRYTASLYGVSCHINF
ncbi:MAG: DUF5683 domain-containing protein [Tannerella sp.]|jgi:hypothetical protein|nr:DUF5683 domain-containing protein [Tannerella sp.]